MMNGEQQYCQRVQRIIAFCELLTLPDGAYVGQNVKLRAWQKEFINAVYGPQNVNGLRRVREALLTMGRKNGKGLALDTPIPTPNGWTTMGELSVGDTLYDENGEECKVSFTSEIHHIDCYEVEFSNGEKIVCDGDHRWLTTARTVRPGGGHNNSRVEHTAVRDVREIYATQTYSARGDRNHSIAMPKAIKGREVSLPIEPYVFGVWLGDGSSRDAKIHCGDKDVHEMKGLIAGCGVPVTQRKDKKNWVIGLTDGTHDRTKDCIKKRLRDLGVLNNKHIPAVFLRASKEQRLAHLQGLMDTDGTCDSRGRAQEFSTVSKRLCDDFCELVASLGLKFSVREKSLRCNGVDVLGTGYYVQFCANRDYMEVFRIKRKLERQKYTGGCSPRSRSLQIVSVRKVPTVPTKCIQVDSPNSLFLCGKTMIPTHNTALIAMLLLVHLCGPEAIRNGQLYSVAFDREQAAIVFKYAAAMVYASEGLCSRLVVLESKKAIKDPTSGSVYQALSAESRTKHGKSSSFIIFDELAQFGNDRELYDTMMTSRGAHAEPLVMVISTQAASDAALLSELVDRGKKIISGEIVDPTSVAFVYEVPADADIFDEANWYLANPALGDFLNIEILREDAEKAKAMPGAEAAFRNLYMNQRVSADKPFVTVDVWKRNGGKPSMDVFESGTPCTAGLDLSSKNDLTALVFAAEGEDHKYHVLPYFWTPKGGIEERAHRDRVPYDLWEKQGYLTATPGAVVDYDYIAAFLGECHASYNITGIRFDRWRVDLLKAAIIKSGIPCYIEGKEEAVSGGLRLIPHGQGFKDFGPAVDRLEDLLLEGRILHGGHPILTMCAANTRVVQDPAGNRKFDKMKSTGRIDGMVALGMAVNWTEDAAPPVQGSMLNWNDYLKEREARA